MSLNHLHNEFGKDTIIFLIYDSLWQSVGVCNLQYYQTREHIWLARYSEFLPKSPLAYPLHATSRDGSSWIMQALSPWMWCVYSRQRSRHGVLGICSSQLLYVGATGQWVAHALRPFLRLRKTYSYTLQITV